MKKLVKGILTSLNKLGRFRRCVACGCHAFRFRAFRGGSRHLPPVVVALRYVGSDVDNFACTACGASDRERHLLLYFDRLDLWSNWAGGTILHFAPEAHLAKRFKEISPEHYCMADVAPRRPDIIPMDVGNISFPDAQVDLIVANHVLEHVEDDQRALREFLRVLKPGGWLVAQTPYSQVLQTTLDDKGINSPELRDLFYGQEDHVRCYGHESLFQLIQQVGFESHIVLHKTILNDKETRFFGVNPEENLMLFRKPE